MTNIFDFIYMSELVLKILDNVRTILYTVSTVRNSVRQEILR